MLTLKRFTMTLWCSLWCPPLGSVLICLADGTPQPPTWSISVPSSAASSVFLDSAVGSGGFNHINQAHGLGLSSPFSAGLLFFIIFVSHNHTLG